VTNPIGGPALHGALDLSGLVRKHATPAPSSTPASPLVRDVDDTTIGELVELSKRVPVILEVYGGELTPQLGPLVESFQGAFVLGTVRGENAPELVQALGIQEFPRLLPLSQVSRYRCSRAFLPRLKFALCWTRCSPSPPKAA
jgi:putative thioredoxin